MKKIFLLIIATLVLYSCNETTSTNKSNVGDSSGNINNVSVFIDDQLWNSEIGDSVRKKLAAPVDGLQNEEPLFNINQYPTKIFDGFVKKGRNIIFIQKGEQNTYSAQKDTYAAPQNLFVISGKSAADIITVFENKADEIITSIKQGEIRENQRRMNKSLVDDAQLEKLFGLKMNIGYGYKYDMVKKDFVWLRKEFTSGYNSILIYTAPIAEVEKDGEITQNIINLRDTIGKQNIHGVIDNTWMETDKAYPPYLFETKINNKFTFLSKGVWYLKNDFMAGPFVNYAIKDTKNNRYVIIEGFTYLPAKAKRDHVFELEAIIHSAKIIN